MTTVDVYAAKADGWHSLKDGTVLGGAPARLFGDPGPGQVYFGINDGNIAEREAYFGHRMGINRSYWNNGTSDQALAQIDEDLAAGRGSWVSFKLENPAMTWGDFAAGLADTWFQGWLADVDTRNAGPVIVTIHHEPMDEEDTTPGSGMTRADYLAMYVHAKTMTDAYPRILLAPIVSTSWFYTDAAAGPHLVFSEWMNSDSADIFAYDIYMPGDTESEDWHTWAENAQASIDQLIALDPTKPHAIAEWGLHTRLSDPTWTTDYMQDVYDYALTYCYCIAYFDGVGTLHTELDSPGPEDTETGPPWVRLDKFGELLAEPTSVFVPIGGLT